MAFPDRIKGLPGRVRKRLVAAAMLACMAATFALPAFGGGYNILKEEPITSSASAIEDVDLLLVAASAFGEARKVMNATDPDKQAQFVQNTVDIVDWKWQNLGLIIGARDSLSGSTWSMFQSPITISGDEISTYGNGNLAENYNKYKAFGFAVQNLNIQAQRSRSASSSVNEGLDAMSTTAIKLGSLGVRFLDEYNPGPVLLMLYDYAGARGTYPENKLVQIVVNNNVLRNVFELLGSPVVGDRHGGGGLSFFVLVNAVLAVAGLALSMLLTLLGNRSIGDGIRKFLSRIVIGTVGLYLISNLLSVTVRWVTDTVLDVGSSGTASYVEENLNLYDWYLTGFQLPSGVELTIGSDGRFIFTQDAVRRINEYTYRRIHGGDPSDEAMKAEMENYTRFLNKGTASFITPTMVSADGAAAWDTDYYYAVMSNYAKNKDLMDGNDDPDSPLYGKSHFSIYQCRYLWMSSLSMSQDGSLWRVSGNGLDSYFGLNPISAFNLVRSDFSGNTISASTDVYPKIAYVAFDVTRGVAASSGSGSHMNAFTRFIASFTLILAALKGLITIFTAGFGGILSGGVKTAAGSSHGLGQALGGVAALVCGIIGISLIMSMTLSLLDVVYGICKDVVTGSEGFSAAFLQPLEESLSGVPILGEVIVGICKSVIDAILSLILALTFPKLGQIPISVFAQAMADLPGKIAEKAQMAEAMLMSGRSSAGGGLPGRHGGGRGQYGARAQQMADRAFSGGARQAGQVAKAAVGASAALAGASLSAAGKAINRKGDKIEGKPANPGVDNWDDLSDEQKGRAAEAAANTEGWEDMSEDARQQALRDAGVYGDNAAEAGGSTDAPSGAGSPGENADGASVSDNGTDNSQDKDTPPTDIPAGDSSPSGTDGAPDEAVPPGADSMPAEIPLEGDGAPVPDVGQEASMNGVGDIQESMEPPVESAGTESGAPDSISAQDADTGPDGMPIRDADSSDSIGAQDGGDGAGQDADAGDTYMEENSSLTGGNQQSDVNVEQKNDMDSLNVDNSRQLDPDVAGADAGAFPDIVDGKNPQAVPEAKAGGQPGSLNRPDGAAGGSAHPAKGGRQDAAGGGNSVSGMKGRTGGPGKNGQGLPATQGGSRQTTAAQQSGASANYQSVNTNNSQTGGNTTMNVNANAQKNTKVNSVSQDRTVNNNQTGQDAHRPDGKAPSQGAGLNGTHTSRYGKPMTIREQRQARALHAVGDALQVMGGNRTVQDGVREALGHAADGLVSYTVSPEMMQTNFAQGIRMERRARNAAQKGQKGNKKK